MERLVAEIEKVKNDTNELLDRKCVGLYTCDVIFLDTKEELCLSNYFDNQKSCFDYYFAGCYLQPGKITTIREIHINALECAIKSKLLSYANKYNRIEPKEEYLIKKFIPELSDFLLSKQ